MISKIKKEFRYGKTFMGFAILKALTQAILFLIPLALAHFLAPEGFGIFSLSMMIVYFFTALLINSAMQPFVVYASEELKKTKKINKTFTAVLVLLALTTLLFFLLTIIFIGPLSQFASLTKSQFWFLLFAYVGIGLRHLGEALFLALNKRIIYGIFSILTAIFSIAYIVLVNIFLTLTLESIFIMFFIAPFLALLFLASTINFSQLFPLRFDKILFKKVFDYTRWVMIGGTASYFITWGDNLVLRYFVSLEEIGLYNLGYQLFKGILLLIGTINMYFLPFVAQNIKNRKKIGNYLFNKRIKLMLLGAFGVASLFFVIPPLMDFLYGNAYEGAIPVFQILLIASIFALYKSFYGPVFNALKRYKFVQTATIFLVALNLALDFIFVPFIGFIGAAVATVITYMAMALTYEIYFRKKIRKLVY